MQENHRVQKNVGNQDEYTGRPGQDREHTLVIEGRNAVLEAFRSGRTIDKLFVLDGCQDGPVRTIIREAKKHGAILNFVGKERLAQLSQTGRHQGVIAYAAAYDYAEVEDMLKLAEERGEDPFLILLDGIEDPHNLGAIIRTAVAAGYEDVYLAGCADPFSPKSVRASMSGVFFARIMQGTRQEVLSVLNVPLIAADMDGEDVFAFRPPEVFCLAVGSEGSGLSEEVRGVAAYTVRIPMDARTESLNAAVSAGILMYALKAGRKF